MDRVCIFGGSFDPIHLGHTACIKHISESMSFSEIFVVPTNLNPLKTKSKPASNADRLEMIELAIRDFAESVVIDDTEMKAEEPSYTWDTLQRYLKDYDGSQIYLAMGQDTFSGFDQWRDYEKILESVNIVVLSRPPFIRPFSKTDFPQGVQPLVHSYEKGFCLLSTNRTIEFVKIATDDISSSDIRKRLHIGKNVGASLPMEVEKYIIKESIYPRMEPGQIDFEKMAQFCGQHLQERAMGTAGYDLRSMDKLYDYTIVASATSTKQAQSFARNLKDSVKAEFGLNPYVEEGTSEGRWVILDYGGVIIHIFYDFVRHEYHLEQLWAEGTRLEFPRNLQ